MQARVLDSAAIAELLRELAVAIEENEPVVIPARQVPGVIRAVLGDILRETAGPRSGEPLAKPLENRLGNPRRMALWDNA